MGLHRRPESSRIMLAILPAITVATPTAATSPDGRRCSRATTARTLAAITVAMARMRLPILPALMAATPITATSPDDRRCCRATTTPTGATGGEERDRNALNRVARTVA